MKRVWKVCLVFLSCAQWVCAENPSDLKFHLRLTGDINVFHAGEAIPLEIAYSSESDKKYQGSFSNPISAMGGQTPEVTPSDGVVNLRDLRNGFAGSFLSSSGYLTPSPRTEHLDLGEWFRFTKSGHFSVRVMSSNISRVKSPEEGGGLEHLTLQSNTVEFEILAPDQAWAAEEQAKFEAVLNTELPDNPAWNAALHRLSKLDTPSSVRRLVEMYLSRAMSPNSWVTESALRDSLQLDVAIPLLRAALTNSSANVPQGLTNLLADLETRKELGVPFDSDRANEEERNAKFKKRAKVRERYLQDANDLLLASMDKRTGPERAVAIYQAWSNAEGLNGRTAVSAELLARLRSSVLSVQEALPHDMQPQFAYAGWQTLLHVELIGLVRNLARESLEAPNSSYDLVRPWCEDAPEECNAAIIKSYLDAEHKPYNAAILLLSESEHSELDHVLQERLRDPEMLYASADSQSTAALVLRAGTQNLVPQVTGLLDKLSNSDHTACEVQGDMLGYLFRFRPKAASKRLNSALQTANGRCGGELLRTLHSHRYSNDLIPSAITALDSPNLIAAQSAALFLGEHGPASARDELWKRLEALHIIWEDRTAELKDNPITFGDTPAQQTAAFEQSLVSALSHATNWKLTPGEIERLRTACLTDRCRSIAEGKMSLSL